MPEQEKSRKDAFAPGIAAVIACFLVAGTATLVCHAVMEETYLPGEFLRGLGIFIADVVAFAAGLSGSGLVCLIAFAVARRKKAALISLVPVCLGPLVIAGIYLLFRYGTSWS